MKDGIFHEDELIKHITHISQGIGPRLVGTRACRETGDYISTYLSRLGMKVQEQSFNIESAEILAHKIEILDPPLGHLQGYPIVFTRDTPPEGLTGELKLIEEGEECFSGNDIRGKIVLWSARERGMAPREICQYDPLAILIISNIPGVKPRHDIQPEYFFKPFHSVPIFRISWEDGYRLAKMEKVKARVTLQTKRFQSQGKNIIADIKGSDFPDEIITISAHYDSPPDTPSATDNASGISLLLEFARLYQSRGSKRTLRFIAFDGEEAGYAGSRYYARSLVQNDGEQSPLYKSSLQKHLLCLNMDVLGMTLGFNTCYVQGPKSMGTAVDLLSSELGVPHRIIEGNYGSDCDPLSLIGIPSASFGRMGAAFYYIHTDEDSLDLISKEQLRKVGTLIDTFILRYAAQSQIWPFKRMIPLETANALTNKMKTLFGESFDSKFEWIESNHS